MPPARFMGTECQRDVALSRFHSPACDLEDSTVPLFGVIANFHHLKGYCETRQSMTEKTDERAGQQDPDSARKEEKQLHVRN